MNVDLERTPRTAVPARRLFAPSGFFALRTPLLPWAEWLQLGIDLKASSAMDRPEALIEAIESDRATLRQRLRDLVVRPEIREALFVASPSLDERLEAWLRDGRDPRNKVQGSVLRYLARMAGRATPFGLFSGCSIGALGDRTRLRLAARTDYERHTRLDMDYLFALTEEIGKDPALRRSVPYYPNTSLYRVGGRWRYVEARVKENSRAHYLVAAGATDYLDATIERARNGETMEALAQALVEGDPDGDITYNDACEFIEELISGHLLISRLMLPVTGREPIHSIIADLDALPVGAELAKILAEVREAIAALDRAPLGSSPALYRNIAGRLEALPTKVELSRLFQVDMVKPADATLGSKVVDELARGVELLHKMSRRPREDNLSRFREAFTRRYEGRQVPLVDVLDEELGIGFERATQGAEDAPLLDEIAIPPSNAEGMSPWGAREGLLLRKLAKATATGAMEIDLSPDDIEELSTRDPLPLPDAFCAMGTVLSASPEELDRGAFRLYFHMASGPSGARLLGRFCHADRNLQSLVEAHLRAEEACRPDAIFAEIVHLPEGRLGNVLCRPVLREHEIVFLGLSGAPDERQILVTDLMVSVVGDRIVVRSKRLGREVIPRMSNAHNFAARSLGTYRFLCELQGQGTIGGLAWSWGALGAAPFLPRVTSGRLVLSRASWNLTEKDLRALGAASDGAMFEAVSKLRTERKLPRWVALQDGDNELPLDLENMLSVETFVHLVKKRPRATLVEMFSDELCAEGPEGRFVHELVVPFVQTPREMPEERSTLEKSISRSRRTFPPGSEWLYAKIYTGAATADRILVDVLSPMVARTICPDGADRWFFIRYGDPDWHLRIRFCGDPARLHSCVLPALQGGMGPLLDEGLVWRFQLDTYERETERYGGPEGLELSEQIFHADSDAVLEIVGLLEEAGGADARWRLALRGMDLLLDDLRLDLDAKLAVVERARRAFAAEFRTNVHLTRTLGARYRKESKSLEMLLDRPNDAEGPLAPSIEVLRRRSERLAPVVEALYAAEKDRRLSLPVAGLAQSYLHMYANRLLRAEARPQELVLYDFLARFYESRSARAGKRQ